jgi:3-hydroxybutyryl-CoA dehydratase
VSESTFKERKKMSKDAKVLAPLPPIGVKASRSHIINAEDIDLFAHVSTDKNPIHIDEEYAARTPFGGRVAHGIMIASMISAVLGNDLPGHGSIYLGQTLKFLAPVRIGDMITVTVEVISLREDKRIVTLRTDCTNQEGTLVLTGEAIIKYVQALE